jgi:hypothetical protein
MAKRGENSTVFQFRLSPDELSELRKYAKRNKLTVTTALRKAIERMRLMNRLMGAPR